MHPSKQPQAGLCLQDVQLSVLVQDKADPYQKAAETPPFSDCAALMRRRISFGLLRLIHFPDKQVSVSEMVAPHDTKMGPSVQIKNKRRMAAAKGIDRK